MNKTFVYEYSRQQLIVYEVKKEPIVHNCSVAEANEILADEYKVDVQFAELI
jgi:hypothetical protein